MSCNDDCHRPSTTTQAHCAAHGCHRTFSRVSGFDRHRRDGNCLDPAALGFAETGRIWRQPISESDRLRLSERRQATAQADPVPVCGSGESERSPA
jgi:hypothetical protein